MSPQAPNAKAVAAQLERILNSSDFNASRRLKNFLRFVVTETLKGNAGQIKAYTIAVTVFGRTHSFDPQTDPVVRIEAGKLRTTVTEVLRPINAHNLRHAHEIIESGKARGKIVLEGFANSQEN